MNTASQKLYETAKNQKGLFTTAQAIKSGYPKNNHTYHVSVGNWQRIVRGVYRLSLFPEDEQEILMAIYLWTRSKNEAPQGCFSHDTALAIYGLSDINPSNIHISVPKSFRKRPNNSLGKMVFYKRNIQNIEFKEIDGLKVTTPLQTLIDVINENSIDHKLIEQATNQSFEKGMITIAQFKKYPKIKKYLRGKNVF